MAMRGPRTVPSDVAAPKSCLSLSSARYGLPVLGLPRPDGGRAIGKMLFCDCNTVSDRDGLPAPAPLTCVFCVADEHGICPLIYVFATVQFQKTP